MEVVAAIGWIIGLAALAAVGWGQQQLTRAREAIEEKAADIGSYKQQLTDIVRESNASLGRVREQAASDKRFAHEPVVKDLLEVVDSFERALETLPDGPEAEGVAMIHKQLLATLERHGVERVPSVGCPFDPELHEAIGTEPTEEVEAQEVLREWCGGYRLHGRVLRAAKVVLAIPVPTEEVPIETEDAPLPLEDTEDAPLAPTASPERAADTAADDALPEASTDVVPEAADDGVPKAADDPVPVAADDAAPGAAAGEE